MSNLETLQGPWQEDRARFVGLGGRRRARRVWWHHEDGDPATRRCPPARHRGRLHGSRARGGRPRGRRRRPGRRCAADGGCAARRAPADAAGGGQRPGALAGLPGRRSGGRRLGGFAGDAFTVKGSGRDIYDTLGFTFVAQPLAGDGEIVAQVNGLAGDNINPGAKAGVIFLAEEGLVDPLAAWAGTFVTPGRARRGSGVRTSARLPPPRARGSTSSRAGSRRPGRCGVPLRLFARRRGLDPVRAGHINGFGPNVLVGLAVSARDDATGLPLVTGTFANVKVTRFEAGAVLPDAGTPGSGGGATAGSPAATARCRAARSRPDGRSTTSGRPCRARPHSGGDGSTWPAAAGTSGPAATTGLRPPSDHGDAEITGRLLGVAAHQPARQGRPHDPGVARGRRRQHHVAGQAERSPERRHRAGPVLPVAAGARGELHRPQPALHLPPADPAPRAQGPQRRGVGAEAQDKWFVVWRQPLALPEPSTSASPSPPTTRT